MYTEAMDAIMEQVDALLQDLEDRLALLLAEWKDKYAPRQEPRLLTERELAEWLRCDPRTIRRLELSGAIPQALRIGGSKRWRADAIVSWMNGLGKNGPRSQS